jgi:quinol monooxygenase YgiN
MEPQTWHTFGDRLGVVFAIIRLFPAPKHRTQIIELLRSVQDLVRPVPGCIGCWVSEEDYLHNHIRYAEQWEAEEALQNHIRSDLYRRILAALELSKHEPDVKFYYCSQTKGLELVEAARRHAKEEQSAANASRS